jgi:hypothetical protein
MTKLAQGQGFEVLQDESGKLHIVLDPTQNFGPSKSGKTTIVASSRGATSVYVNGEDLYINLNVYKK